GTVVDLAEQSGWGEVPGRSDAGTRAAPQVPSRRCVLAQATTPLGTTGGTMNGRRPGLAVRAGATALAAMAAALALTAASFAAPAARLSPPDPLRLGQAPAQLVPLRAPRPTQ